MRNMHIKYFMVLTVFILGLGDVPLHAAKKSGSSSTPPKPAQSTQAPAAPQLSPQYKKELTDILKAVHDSENILKKLQKDLTDQKGPKAKQQTSKDLASSLSSVQKLLPLLIKLQKELPGAQKAGQMLTIKPVDLAKAIDTTNDVVKKIKSVQKSLDKEKAEVKTQITRIEYAILLAVIAVCLIALATQGNTIQDLLSDS